MRIAVSAGGGDAPGLNAVIRGAVLAAVHRGWECVGIRRVYGGLLGEDRVVPLDAAAVRGITHLGGTILGTTNRGDAFRWPERLTDGREVERDRSDELVKAFRALGLDALIGRMVALRPPSIAAVSIDEALDKPKRVPLDSDTIATARDLGISLGD